MKKPWSGSVLTFRLDPDPAFRVNIIRIRIQPKKSIRFRIRIQLDPDPYWLQKLDSDQDPYWDQYGSKTLGLFAMVTHHLLRRSLRGAPGPARSGLPSSNTCWCRSWVQNSQLFPRSISLNNKIIAGTSARFRNFFLLIMIRIRKDLTKEDPNPDPLWPDRIQIRDHLCDSLPMLRIQIDSRSIVKNRNPGSLRIRGSENQSEQRNLRKQDIQPSKISVIIVACIGTFYLY